MICTKTFVTTGLHDAVDEAILFDGLPDVVRVALTAPIMYATVVVAIRFAGKRSTSQMNNFDWIVTVAVGSLVGSGIILEDVTVSEAGTGVVALLSIQRVVTKLAFHTQVARTVVKAQPALLVDEGKLQTETMAAERVTQNEVFAALRRNGLTDPSQAKWVILESDATMSVIPESHEADAFTAVESIAQPRAKG